MKTSSFPSVVITNWDPVERGDVVATGDICIAGVITVCKMRLIFDRQTGKMRVQPTQHTYQSVDGIRRYDSLVKLTDWRFRKHVEKAILDYYEECMKARRERNASHADLEARIIAQMGGEF